MKTDMQGDDFSHMWYTWCSGQYLLVWNCAPVLRGPTFLQVAKNLARIVFGSGMQKVTENKTILKKSGLHFEKRRILWRWAVWCRLSDGRW